MECDFESEDLGELLMVRWLCAVAIPPELSPGPLNQTQFQITVNYVGPLETLGNEFCCGQTLQKRLLVLPT